MKIPLVDLVAQYRSIQGEIDAAVREVLERGAFILGSNVTRLEQELAAYLGVAHGVGVGNGTDALVLALRAMGIGPGDEVIVPTYTFFATAEAVMLLGATPVFVDVEPETFGLDVRQVRERITRRTKAVIPVHLYGHPADLTAVQDVARAHGIRVLEDNAQAIGAEWRGQRTGSFGDAACLSFFPSKNLGAYGDAGMVVTNDPEIAERIRMLRTHGWRAKYEPTMVGYNSRLDELQAAILRVKLRHLDAWNDRRRALAARYTERLAGRPVRPPRTHADATHVYHVYVVELEDRDRVQRYLTERGIGSSVYYPRPLHLVEACAPLGYKAGDFPVAEEASRRTLALPLYPEMSDAQLDHVVAVLDAALAESPPSR